MEIKKNKLGKRWGLVAVLAALGVLAVCLALFASPAGARAAEEEKNFLSADFTAAQDAELFDAYYSADGETAQKVNFADYWEIADGKLTSKTATGYASLILKEHGLQSYEMQADYTASESGGYLALLSKMRRKGVSSRGAHASSYVEYGCGAFVQGGKAVLQGDFRCIGLDDAQGVQSADLTGYDASKTHTLKLRCYNDLYTLWIDGVKAIEYKGAGGIGFMGLQAVKSAGSFDNFTVKLLDIGGEYADLTPSEDIIRVAAVGDSLTFGSSENAYISADTTPGQLQTLLGSGYDVRNFGLGGRTAIEGSGSCIMDDAEYELAKKYRADIIYIMLGTNDSQTTAGYWGNDLQEGAQKFMDGYQKIIDGLLETSPDAKMYLLISPTYRHTGLSHLTEEMIATRARVYTPKVAERNGLTVIDANAVTKNIGTEHLFDYIHFDRYGYGLIAEAIYKQIALDSTETLTLPYGGGESGIALKIDETMQLRQTSRTNPVWSVVNSEIAELTADGQLTAKAAGTTSAAAVLGNQRVEFTVTVANNFTLTDVRPAKTDLKYGDALPQLTAVLPVTGELRYEEGAAPQMGTHDYNWVFTPLDAKYAPERGTVQLTYAKATPAAEKPTVANMAYTGGQTLRDVKLPTGYEWKNADTSVTEGRNRATAVFVPEDAEHYESVEFTVSFWAVPTEVAASGGSIALMIVIGALIGIAAVAIGFVVFKLVTKNKKKAAPQSSESAEQKEESPTDEQ